ncbi:MAG: ATP-dependent DNA ligase [Planctomycetota bacterium]
MQRFAELYSRLDQTTKTSRKTAALAWYFSDAGPADAAWAIYFLSGRRMSRIVKTTLLRQWAAALAGIPDWLFDECYDRVGDLAETISLVVPPADSMDAGAIANTPSQAANRSLADWVTRHLVPLRSMEEHQQQIHVQEYWRQTSGIQRFVLMKLITGAFRVGVSRRLVTRGLSDATGIDVEVLSHRLMGNWEPNADFYNGLLNPDTDDAVLSRPYPFCLAHALDNEVSPQEQIGSPEPFIAEWKWDGIRCQLIRRSGATFLWSRGEELMENRWPEIESAAQQLPDGTVLDGEILAIDSDDNILPFMQLQRRINRKTIGKKLLTEVPVRFRAFDLLEMNGEDLRSLPMQERRERLESLLQPSSDVTITPTELIPATSWEQLAAVRATSREHHSEGLMIKRRDATYSVGRVTGVWWKWKIEPMTVDAVLIYAQRGHGKRASLYTDYTFALWDNDELVPFAKAYSGLTDAEIRRVDAYVRKNTRERFGPVRSVTPELVMELAFEGLQKSSRHKSGIAVRFPRIARWRTDLSIHDADQLQSLKDRL